MLPPQGSEKISGERGAKLPPDLSPGIQYGSGKEGPSITCFQCGECCTRYHVLLTQAEAEIIARSLNMTFPEWESKYAERWPWTDRLMLRHNNMRCIFLAPETAHRAKCLIHPVKPKTCREWRSTLYSRECREGLRKHWGLTLAPSGELEGSEEQRQRFINFLKSVD